MAPLFQGIFWVQCLYDETGYPDLDTRKLLAFKIPCDADGELLPDSVIDIQPNAKSGKSFNHKALWRDLPKKITLGHSYQYYPRGRVEIRRSQALIYINPIINTEPIINDIRLSFGLDSGSVGAVLIKCDGSSHYHCHYDDPAIQ